MLVADCTTCTLEWQLLHLTAEWDNPQSSKSQQCFLFVLDRDALLQHSSIWPLAVISVAHLFNIEEAWFFSHAHTFSMMQCFVSRLWFMTQDKKLFAPCHSLMLFRFHPSFMCAQFYHSAQLYPLVASQFWVTRILLTLRSQMQTQPKQQQRVQPQCNPSKNKEFRFHHSATPLTVLHLRVSLALPSHLMGLLALHSQFGHKHKSGCHSRAV